LTGHWQTATFTKPDTTGPLETQDNDRTSSPVPNSPVSETDRYFNDSSKDDQEDLFLQSDKTKVMALYYHAEAIFFKTMQKPIFPDHEMSEVYLYVAELMLEAAELAVRAPIDINIYSLFSQWLLRILRIIISRLVLEIGMKLLVSEAKDRTTTLEIQSSYFRNKFEQGQVNAENSNGNTRDHR